MRSKLSLSDEWETPRELYEELCEKYKLDPKLDVCATPNNTKCYDWFEVGGLTSDWVLQRPEEKVDVWCNPPHSNTFEWVQKAYLEWFKFNINIIMIIPTNTMSSGYWHVYIEPHTEYHPIVGRIRFLQDGKPSKYPSRNAYVCVIWRKK